MELVIIALIIGLAALIALMFFLLTQSNDNSHPGYHTPPYQPHSSVQKQDTQIPITPKPIMTSHASERISERMHINGQKQKEIMENAFKNGRTVSNTTGDLKYKLQDVEQKHSNEGEVVAKFYNGAIFVFTKEDNVLKTAFPYNVNNGNRYYH